MMRVPFEQKLTPLTPSASSPEKIAMPGMKFVRTKSTRTYSEHALRAVLLGLDSSLKPGYENEEFGNVYLVKSLSADVVSFVRDKKEQSKTSPGTALRLHSACYLAQGIAAFTYGNDKHHAIPVQSLEEEDQNLLLIIHLGDRLETRRCAIATACLWFSKHWLHSR